MCHRGGPSIAAFLQQAEDNLALLGARADGAPWPAAHLSAFINPLGVRERRRPRQSQRGCLEEERRPGLVSDSAGEVTQSGSEFSDYGAVLQCGVGSSSATNDAARGRLRRPERGDAAGSHAVTPRALETWATRLEGARAAVDDALQRAEERHLEAKEQMDVQAKTMLGLDRKVRSFDGRVRAVEAAVAAAADVAAGAAAAASDASAAASSSNACGIESAGGRRALSPAVAGGTRAASAGARNGAGSGRPQAADQQLADLERRVSALAEGSRREREATRQTARRAAESYTDELRVVLEQRLDSFEHSLRERDERYSEQLEGEVRRCSEQLGRDLAGELLRGSVSELVDRRVNELGEQLHRTLEEALGSAEHMRVSSAENLEKLVREQVSAAMAEEATAAVAAAGTPLPNGSTGLSPGNILRRLVESVGSLEARARDEEQTYWDSVQALEQRVADLEEAADGAVSDTNLERAAVMRRIAQLELDTQMLKQPRAAVVQDPAAARADAVLRSPNSSASAAAVTAAAAMRADAGGPGETRHGSQTTPRRRGRNAGNVVPPLRKSRGTFSSSQGVAPEPESGLHIAPLLADTSGLRSSPSSAAPSPRTVASAAGSNGRGGYPPASCSSVSGEAKRAPAGAAAGCGIMAAESALPVQATPSLEAEVAGADVGAHARVAGDAYSSADLARGSSSVPPSSSLDPDAAADKSGDTAAPSRSTALRTGASTQPEASPVLGLEATSKVAAETEEAHKRQPAGSSAASSAGSAVSGKRRAGLAPAEAPAAVATPPPSASLNSQSETMSATGSRALPPGTADAQHQKMQESQQDKESENLDEILAGLDDDLASFASSTPLDLPLSATTSAYGGEGGGGVAEAAGAAAVRPTHNAAGPGGATASCAGGSGDGSDGDLDLDLELDLPM